MAGTLHLSQRQLMAITAVRTVKLMTLTRGALAMVKELKIRMTKQHHALQAQRLTSYSSVKTLYQATALMHLPSLIIVVVEHVQTMTY